MLHTHALYLFKRLLNDNSFRLIYVSFSSISLPMETKTFREYISNSIVIKMRSPSTYKWIIKTPHQIVIEGARCGAAAAWTVDDS